MLFENKYVGTSNGAEENGYHLKPSNVVETKFSFVNYKVKENDNHVQLLTKAIQNQNLLELRQLINEIPAQSKLDMINQVDSENGVPLLHQACRCNFSEAVEVLLKNGASISLTDSEGRQPIHHAAKFHRIPRFKMKNKNFSNPSSAANKKTCLEVLIKEGANVRVTDRYQATPLHHACSKGHHGAVELLLQQNGIAVEAMDDHQSTALHEATKNGHLDVVQSLLGYCIQNNLELLHLKDSTGSTPLIHSSRNGYTKIVEVLLMASNQSSLGGTLLRMMDRDLHGNTALHEAVDGGYFETVKILLDTWKQQSVMFQGTYDYFISEKPYADLERNDGYTAMHLAANQGAAEIVQLLVDERAAMDCKDENSETPLFLAAEKNHISCVEILLKNLCNVEISNHVQLTPYLIACKNNNSMVAKMLIKANADVTAVDNQCRNCFILAAANGNDDTLQVLLELPEREELMKDCDNFGNTALHEASRMGHLSTLKVLVDNGVPLNICNDCDETALHLAASNNHVDVIDYVIAKERARLDDVDDYSKTPLFLAASLGHVKVVEKLIKSDAKTDISDVRSWTALHTCASKGWTECAKKLLEANPSLINKTTLLKETALHLACKSESTEIVSLLLDHNCDVSARQFDGRNALDVAVDENNPACVKILLKNSTWEQSMQNVTYTESGSIATPLRKMIKSMPEIVESVLTKCITKSEGGTKDGHLEVTFNYELIEDMYEAVTWNGGTRNSNDYENVGLDNGDVQQEMDLTPKKNSLLWASSPTIQPSPLTNKSLKIYDEHGKLRKDAKPYSGTSSQLYQNHPLKLMADTKQGNLLSHPTITSLLYLKWKRYGRKFFFINLLTYILYLALLNYYVFSTPPRFAINDTQTESAAQNGNSCVTIITEEQEVWGYGCQDYILVRYVAVALVLTFASFQLLKEIIQLIHQRLAYFLEYTNYIEVTLYALSIAVFVDADPFVSHTGLRDIWQWEGMAFVILLSWVNLLLYIRRSPLGIYVLMIETVSKSFAKFGLIVMIFLVGFASSFYVVLQNQFAFDKPVPTWVKTLVMMTGEYDFSDIFLAHFTSDAYQDRLIYQVSSYIIFVIFVLSMSLIISNLLVGIAVDDIALVQEQATVRRLALQVNGMLDLEYALPAFIRRRMVAREYTIRERKLRQNLFFDWLLSEEKVNMDTTLAKLKDAENSTKVSSNGKTPGSGFKAMEVFMRSLISNQTQIESQLEEMQRRIDEIKNSTHNYALVQQLPHSSQSLTSMAQSVKRD